MMRPLDHAPAPPSLLPPVYRRYDITPDRRSCWSHVALFRTRRLRPIDRRVRASGGHQRFRGERAPLRAQLLGERGGRVSHAIHCRGACWGERKKMLEDGKQLVSILFFNLFRELRARCVERAMINTFFRLKKNFCSAFSKKNPPLFLAEIFGRDGADLRLHSFYRISRFPH